jgi:hypothetical protein
VVWRGLLLVAAALLLGPAGARGASQGARTLALAGPVRELAADGGRVAILLRTSRPNCAQDRVAVWGPSTRTLVPIGAAPCARSTSTGTGLFGVALAGTRVAYVQFAGGNARELELRLATLAQPRPATVASAAFGLDAEQGTYIGRLAGDGALLAFDWWSLCRPCADVNPTGPRGSVWRIVPAGSACPDGGLGSRRRCALVQAALGRLRLLAVGGGLVALKAADGSLVVTSAAGAVRSAVPFAPGQLRAARIDGDGKTIVALVSSGGRNTLSVLTPAGTVRRTIPLRATKTAGDDPCGDPEGCSVPALRLEDLHAGVAVYVLGRDLHLVDVTTGRDRKIRVPGGGPVHAQLEAPGLFYSYQPASSRNRGRVAFVPTP